MCVHGVTSVSWAWPSYFFMFSQYPNYFVCTYVNADQTSHHTNQLHTRYALHTHQLRTTYACHVHIMCTYVNCVQLKIFHVPLHTYYKLKASFHQGTETLYWGLTVQLRLTSKHLLQRYHGHPLFTVSRDQPLLQRLEQNTFTVSHDQPHLWCQNIFEPSDKGRPTRESSSRAIFTKCVHPRREEIPN